MPLPLFPAHLLVGGAPAGLIEYRPTPDTARTEWDDGAVRQARIRTTVYHRVRATFEASHHDRLALQAWIARHGHAWFDWRGPSGWRRGRIAGGQAGVRWRQVRRVPGAARWQCETDIEEVSLSGPANLWDDSIALGAASGVIDRRTRTAPFDPVADTLSYALIAADNPATPPTRIPAALFPAAAAAAYTTHLGLRPNRTRAPIVWALGSVSDIGSRSIIDGPNILPDALPYLIHVFRRRPDDVVVAQGGTGISDTTEPYQWRPPNAADLAEWLARWQAAPASTVDWAVVWVGPGTAVDPYAQHSAGGGGEIVLP